VSAVVPGAVAGTPGAAVIPGAVAGTPGAAVIPGAVAGTPGAVVSDGAAGEAAVLTGADKSGLLAGEAVGPWAKAVSAVMTEHRLTMSVFFILGRLMFDRRFRRCLTVVVYHRGNDRASSKNLFESFCGGDSSPGLY
jgi:hypothetical protein